MIKVEEGFNARAIPKDDNIQAVLTYVNKQGLKKLGEGSSRIAFLLSSKKVLKVAKNAAGISQNEEEVKVARDEKYNGLVAKIFDFSPTYHWIVSELVHEMTNESFHALTGLDWSQVRRFFYYLSRFKKEYNEWKEIISYLDLEFSERAQYLNHPILNSLFDKLQGSSIHPAELVAISHWGKTADGNMVILDYGLTPENYSAYYVKGALDKGVFENFIRKIVLEEINKLKKRN